MDIEQSLIDEILVNFYAHSVKWRVNGSLHEPTEEDVRKLLDSLYEVVKDGGENTQAATGGILVQNNEGHLDLYVHIGVLK